MVYYNPDITGQYNPLYNPTNQFFFRGSRVLLFFFSEEGVTPPLAVDAWLKKWYKFKLYERNNFIQIALWINIQHSSPERFFVGENFIPTGKFFSFQSPPWEAFNKHLKKN